MGSCPKINKTKELTKMGSKGAVTVKFEGQNGDSIHEYFSNVASQHFGQN